jgi:hypothetical protein
MLECSTPDKVPARAESGVLPRGIYKLLVREESTTDVQQRVRTAVFQYSE